MLPQVFLISPARKIFFWKFLICFIYLLTFFGIPFPGHFSQIQWSWKTRRQCENRCALRRFFSGVFRYKKKTSKIQPRFANGQKYRFKPPFFLSDSSTSFAFFYKKTIFSFNVRDSKQFCKT